MFTPDDQSRGPFLDNLTDIAVFVRVVERGSFTLAADDLALSRAVVSKYVSRLEDRLGARLLHRTTRRLSLTEAGAALFEASRGAAMFGQSTSDVALLLAAGVISTTPLLLFTEAARRLPYATVGMLQFLAPTVQFGLAVLVYDEPFTRAHAVAFAAIWIAVALYTSGIIANRRKLAASEIAASEA